MHVVVILLHCYFVTVYAVTPEFIARDFVNQLKSNCVTAFFTYQHNPKKCLLHLIQNEKKAIQIAAYNLTCQQVVDELLKAKKERKVKIEVITGLDGIRCHGEKITHLSKAGIPTFVISSGNVLMHNKYILFEQNIFSKWLLWTGSANITERGLTKNYENVTVITEPKIIQNYQNNFNFLKKLAQKSPSILRLACGNSKTILILSLVRGMISSIR